MTALARLEIGRLEANYLVARDQPAIASLAQKLDEAAARLGPRLGELLSSIETGSPRAIWLIRRIELELGLDAGGELDRIATSWAAALARAIARKLDRNAHGVVMFETGAVYLAHFLTELAAERAWSTWYFRTFEGLRSLPLSPALRTAILADPVEGLEALLLLDMPERVRVLDSLSALEAGRVLEGLAEAGSPDPIPGATLLLDAFARAELSTLCPDRLALHHFLTLAEFSPGQRGPSTAASARALSTLRLAAAQGWTSLLAAFSAGRLPELYRTTETPAAERLVPLLRLPASLRASLVAACRQGTARSLVDVRDTRFGGLFLLLRDLDGLPMREPAGWPGPAGIDAPQLVRFLVLATCTGPERALAAFLDPLWRDLFAVPGPFAAGELSNWAGTLPTASIRRWARSLPGGTRRRRAERSWPSLPSVLQGALAQAADHLLARFASRLPGFASSSPPYLRANFLQMHARVVLEEASIEVELDRPPLHVILQMSGIGRTRLHLLWLDARPVDLQPGP